MDDYRAGPCPHCDTRPDDTPDAVSALLNCLDARILEIVAAHGLGLGRYTRGRVFWYRRENAWCRVTRSVAYTDAHPGLAPLIEPPTVPIEYADPDVSYGLIPIDADPDDLLDWDPDDPRLPEGDRRPRVGIVQASELRRAGAWTLDAVDELRRSEGRL